MLDQLRAINVITSKQKLNPKMATIWVKYPTVYRDMVYYTKFLDQYNDVSDKMRLWCIIDGVTVRPSCQGLDCCDTTKFDDTIKKFKQYCSPKCSNSSPDKLSQIVATKRELYGENYEKIVEKAKHTNSERYGVETVLQSDEIRQKVYATNLERYGTKHIVQSDMVRERVKQSNLDKYGVEHYWQSDEGKKGRSEAFNAKYGVNSPMQLDEFKNKQHSTMLERHGNVHALCVDQFKIKQEQTNIDRHGAANVMQCPDIQQKQEQTMFDAYGQRHALRVDQFKEKVVHTNRRLFNGYIHPEQMHIDKRTLAKLDDVEWLTQQHHNEKKSMTEIAYELGVDVSTVCHRAAKFGIEVYKYGQSLGQKQISDWIESSGITVHSNDRSIIPPRELDIFIPSHNLAIEYCGVYWHSEQMGRDKHYHANKMYECNKRGIRLLTIFEDEWINSPQVVKNTIANILRLNSTPSVYARNTQLTVVSNEQSVPFYDQCHIQGHGPGGITYGLMHGDHLVACMSFVHKSEHQYYLSRFATSMSVVGGFSKLLQHFVRNHQFEQIISFADLRWSEGHTYLKNGFELDKIIPPDYSYSVDGHTREHKFNFRHINLHNKISGYDPQLSERVNCDNAGILRVWDCGKMRFVLN